MYYSSGIVSNREQRIEYYLSWGIPQDYKDCINYAQSIIDDIDETTDQQDYYKALYSIGFFLESCNDNEIMMCFDLIKQIECIPFFSGYGFKSFIQTVLPHHERLPTEITDPILNAASNCIRHELRNGGLLHTAKILYQIDENLLTPILKKCRKSWFTDHTIIVVKDGKKIRDKIYGPYLPSDDEFSDYIIRTVDPKLRLGQRKTISDVYSATYDQRKDMNAEAKSHKGLINKTIGDRDEKYVQLAFTSKITKVKENNIKNHNTPDFIVLNDSGIICAVAECRTHTSGMLKNNFYDAINHATKDKAPGWKLFCKKNNISENTPIIAVSVQDFNPRVLYMSHDEIKKIVESLTTKDKTVCCLLLIALDFVTYKHRIVVIKREGHDVPNVFKETAEFIDADF